MNNTTRYIIFYILPILIGFFYTTDLVIKNTEEIFLTKNGLLEYDQFKKEYGDHQYLIMVFDKEEDYANEVKKIDQVCKEDCFYTSTQKNEKSKKRSLTIINQSKEQINSTTRDWLNLYPNNAIAGPSYINTLLDQNSDIIGKKVFPLFFLLMSVITMILFRSFILFIFTILPTIFAAIFSQVIIKLIFNTSNIIITITPLLCSILTFMAMIHLGFEMAASGSCRLAYLRKVKPIKYMAYSTGIGFCSLYFSPISVIANFGVLTGVLILVIFHLFLFSTYYIPIKTTTKINTPTFPKSIKNNKLYAWFFLTLFSIFLAATPFYFKQINIEKDASNYFSSELKVKEKLKIVFDYLKGTPILDIIVPLKQFDEKTSLKTLEQIEEMIKEQTGLGILSANELVKVGNQKYSGQKTLPTSSLSYYPIYARVPTVLRDQYPLNENYRLTLLGVPSSGELYSQILANVSQILKKMNIRHQFAGEYYWLMEAQENIIHTLLVSFLLTIFFISLIVAYLFKSIKTIISFIIINLAPIVITLLMFPLLGLSLNIATVMAFSISIGLMVDSTFHLFYERSKTSSLLEIHKKTIMPIFWGNIILSGMFVLFSFIDFLPIKQFGQTMSLLIMLGLIFDLYVLPYLLKFDEIKKI